MGFLNEVKTILKETGIQDEFKQALREGFEQVREDRKQNDSRHVRVEESIGAPEIHEAERELSDAQRAVTDARHQRAAKLKRNALLSDLSIAWDNFPDKSLVEFLHEILGTLDHEAYDLDDEVLHQDLSRYRNGID